MTNDEFKASMERVLAFYASPRSAEEAADFKRYMSALFEVVGTWNGFEFDQVTRQIVNEISPLKKPMPAQFISIRSRIRDERQRSHAADTTEESVEHKRAWVELQADFMAPSHAKAALIWVEKFRSLVPNFPSHVLLKLMDNASQCNRELRPTEFGSAVRRAAGEPA